MKVLISGASGLVGSELSAFHKERGDDVSALVRRSPQGENEIKWDPSAKTIDTDKLGGFDVVYHLAGESIAEGRWTAAKKARIRDSRVDGTTLLSEALAGIDAKPGVLVSASAIGYYGDRGDEVMWESSAVGEGYLPEVSAAWEQASVAASEAGIRVVNPRIGIVLSTKGGALAKMLPPFRLGAGGRIGSGEQFMSWITLTDLVGVLYHCATTEEAVGPVNAVAPDPVTNSQFTQTLARLLNRPAIVPVPALGARLAFGEMADALLLSSTRVSPTKLSETGYSFQHGFLAQGIKAVL